MMIANRMKTFEASGIRKVFDMAKKIKNPINLSIGQPHFDVPQKLKKMFGDLVDQKTHGYTQTQGNGELVEMIKKEVSKKKSLDDFEMMITSGVSGGIFLSLSVLLNPNDEMVVFDPYFVMYKQIATWLGAKVVCCDTYPNFSVDIEKLEKHLSSKTKVLVLNSPSNPTGYVNTEDELLAIAKLAEKYGFYVISDEIYERFCYNESYLKNGFPSFFGKCERMILLNGFSKSHGVTGWRIGYAVGPPEIIEAMSNLQQYTFVCAPSTTQNVMLGAYDKEVIEVLDEHILDYKNKRDFVYKTLREDYEIVKSEGAFYFFVKCPFGNSESFVKRAIEKKLLIVPGNVFSRSNTHFRISFSASDSMLKQGCDILLELVREK